MSMKALIGKMQLFYIERSYRIISPFAYSAHCAAPSRAAHRTNLLNPDERNYQGQLGCAEQLRASRQSLAPVV
jgi:hypothetical protein